MKRQDELNEAWCKYMGKCSTEIMQALAFALRWTDAHPRWISVEDELPPKQPNREQSKNVLVRTNSGRTKIEYYDYGNDVIKEWWEYNITHWMPLPQPPKGGEEWQESKK